MKIDHIKIGSMDVLLQFATSVNGQPQYLGFAKSFYRLQETGYRTFNTYSNSSRLKPIYYLLWSNTPDMHLAGATELQTKSGKSMTYNSAFKLFKEYYFANATDLVSLITVTLICPGYVISV